MVCRRPILSSGVHGVVEQVRPDLAATLIPSGGTVALCEAIARLLQSPDLTLATLPSHAPSPLLRRQII